jgi:hypothetical protein
MTSFGPEIRALELIELCVTLCYKAGVHVDKLLFHKLTRLKEWENLRLMDGEDF